MYVGPSARARRSLLGLFLCAMLPPIWAFGAGKCARAQQPAVPASTPDSNPDPQLTNPQPLEQRVRAILSEPAVARAHWGVAVAGLDGTPMLSINAGQLFQPASTAKLFTTAAALSLLGPESTVTTKVVGRGVFASPAELRGDLVLVGAGDANLSGRTLPYVPPQPRPRHNAGESPAPPDPDPLHHLAAMADAVAATGLKVVTGDILGDDTLLPWEPYAEGWELDDLVWGYGAPVSALSVADNQVRLTVTPGAHAGQPAAVEVAQAVPFYVVEAMVGTVAPGNKSSSVQGGVQVELAPGTRVLRVYGEIAADAGPDVEEVAVGDPAEYAALALKSLLEARGIDIRGRALAQHLYSANPKGFLGESKEPIAGMSNDRVAHSAPGVRMPVSEVHTATVAEKQLASSTSPPLAGDVTVTNKTSQNLHAELLLHRLGLAVLGDGSTAAGVRVLRQFLLNAGLEKDAFVFFDGSGLSTHDLVAPGATVQLLAYAARQPWFPQWKTSLPIGGIDGTLASRFTHDPLKAHVFAKTGTLGEARALAGYLQCASGRTVLFDIMDSAHQPGSSADREAMDRIVAAIAAGN